MNSIIDETFIIYYKFNKYDLINKLDSSKNSLKMTSIKKKKRIQMEYQLKLNTIKIFGVKYIRRNKNKCYIVNKGKKYTLVDIFMVESN